MTNEETADTNAKQAGENVGGRTSEKPFEIPECCRRMMAQMMGGSFSDPAEGGEERAAQNGSASPGVFGRLMLRMMKACCGSFAENGRRTV